LTTCTHDVVYCS